jgi:hypothetical protein
MAAEEAARFKIMTYKTHHLKLPILSSFVFGSSKKRNEPKVGEASLLRYHSPRPEGTSTLFPFCLFIQTNPIKNFAKKPYMLIVKGHIKHEIILQPAKK